MQSEHNQRDSSGAVQASDERIRQQAVAILRSLRDDYQRNAYDRDENGVRFTDGGAFALRASCRGAPVSASRYTLVWQGGRISIRKNGQYHAFISREIGGADVNELDALAHRIVALLNESEVRLQDGSCIHLNNESASGVLLHPVRLCATSLAEQDELAGNITDDRMFVTCSRCVALLNADEAKESGESWQSGGAPRVGCIFRSS